ncbi:hypothetical protein RB595_005270 [Gaeumannomyces hyphopodioides]
MGKDDYDKLARSLCSCDPRIEKSSVLLGSPSSTKDTWVPWRQVDARVVVLRLGSDGFFQAPIEYTEASDLARHLTAVAAEAVPPADSPSREVYLVEGLCEEFVAVLGGHFQIHPSLFADHERLVPFGGRHTGESGGIPFLPSAISGRDHVALKYHELVVLPARPPGFRNMCATSGRHMAVTRLMGELSEVVISRRKFTFWSKITGSGGWECIILCDPPIRHILTDYSGRSGFEVVTAPYASGYLDFMPLSNQMKARGGPPRTSLLEDISFYLQHHSGALGGSNLLIKDPKPLRVFVDKIVASHFLKLAEFLQANIDTVQWQLSRRRDLAHFPVLLAEELWSDVQSWQRRVAEYQDDLEGIMLQLGVALRTDPDTGGDRNWTDSAVDFQHLLRRYRELGARTRALGDAVSSLGSLTGNRAASRSAELSLLEAERAGREARRVKALTILGVVFLPLSLSTSIFSMADQYLPGSSSFWVYFAVSIPLIGLVTFVYWVMEIGYADARSNWSLRVAVASVRTNVGWAREQNKNTLPQQSSWHIA